MVDQYFTEIFEICHQSTHSTIPIHVLKCRKILKKMLVTQCVGMNFVGMLVRPKSLHFKNVSN